ncbi:MAG: hypothetical protein WA821_15555, partial [Anaerolineales bacterium]
ENTLDGLPICRPLFINDPHDKSLYNDKKSFLNNEFIVGKNILVAPVLEPQSQSGYNNFGKRDVYLPAGSNWYCFMDNVMPLSAAVDGGATIRDFDANLNLYGSHINFIVPMYVRAGAIIPTIELEQYVGQLNSEGKPNPITLNIYPDPDKSRVKNKNTYTMYLDDGVSRSSAPQKPQKYGGDPQAKSEYRRTYIASYYLADKLREIKIDYRAHSQYTPEFEEYYFVAILHDPSETKGSSGCLKSVKVNGQELNLITDGAPEQRSDTLNASAATAWYYNENINISFIKVFDDKPLVTITVEYF